MYDHWVRSLLQMFRVFCRPVEIFETAITKLTARSGLNKIYSHTVDINLTNDK